MIKTAAAPDLARFGDLNGKTVFISGGATGIGADLVTAFAYQGAKTWFVDLNSEAAEALVSSLASATGNAPVFIAQDVTDTAGMRAAIDGCAVACGRLDALVNNAANDTRHQADTADEAFWDWCAAVNIKHQFFAAQSAFAHMRRAGGGSIINFGSVAPRIGERNLSIYSTAKSAVRGLTRSLAREFGTAGVRVNAIVPGVIFTERQLALWIKPGDEERIMDHQCLPRRLVGRDIAQMALFLASDVSSGCTSQDFIVDAGLTG